MKMPADLPTTDRIVQGLKTLQNHKEVFFEPAAHRIAVTFAGEPGFFEASRVLDFYNYISAHVYSTPFISSLRRESFRVVYGYNTLSMNSKQRLDTALNPRQASFIAGDLGIVKVSYSGRDVILNGSIESIDRGLKYATKTAEERRF